MTDETKPGSTPADPARPAPQTAAAPASPAPAAPQTPAAAAPAATAAAKPAVAPKAAAADMTRRNFLSTLGVAWTAFAAACGAGAIATGRFMFPNVLFEPPQSFKAGMPDEFITGTVDNRFKETFGVFVVRNEEGIYALKAVCTHLGCTPNWLDAENKFKCPCHGSGFYRTGVNFEGPAPRPLERYRIVLAEDGQIIIDKTKSFAYEKGEWTSPESFLQV
jgi:cytochrome b6-f complex iron-sulfur subunit